MSGKRSGQDNRADKRQFTQSYDHENSPSTVGVSAPLGSHYDSQRRSLPAPVTDGLARRIPSTNKVRRSNGRSCLSATSKNRVYPSGIHEVRTLTAPPNWFGIANHLWLDLGKVKNIAQVSLNGKNLGIVWKAPFRVDVTSALKPGTNRLQVKVTNLWVNRLIGDAQADAANKFTFTTQPLYKADSPLPPSRLLGPVHLIREGRVHKGTA
jgi:hypothetical protein